MPSLLHRSIVLVAALALACGCSGSTPSEPAPPPQPPPAGGSALVLRTASFQGMSGHHAVGDAAIVQNGASFQLELADNFQTDETSFVEVRLCRSGRTCTDGDLSLGAIKARRGAQTYPLPDAATSFSHVVIWCVPFRVPFGSGELR